MTFKLATLTFCGLDFGVRRGMFFDNVCMSLTSLLQIVTSAAQYVTVCINSVHRFVVVYIIVHYAVIVFTNLLYVVLTDFLSLPQSY